MNSFAKKYILAVAMSLLPLSALAQLNQTTCFCSNPKDCEVGTVTCTYDLKIDQIHVAETLVGKFVSGDDPSPEVGARKIHDIDRLTRVSTGFFAATCNTRTFGAGFQIDAYRFTDPMDFNKWEHITKPIHIQMPEIIFNGKSVETVLIREDEKLALKLSCRGDQP